jgi:branched-chain amino acid transport system permease protein
MIKKNSKSPYLITSYSIDMRLDAFITPFRRLWAAIGILIFLIFPLWASDYFIHIANLIAISCIGAIALNLVCGTAGLLSLGHAGFMASGAFTAAILAANLNLPFLLVIPASAVVGALLGAIAGLPALRLRGIYLGLSTLAMHYIIYYACSEYQFHAGSGFGITVPDPSILGVPITSDIKWYFILGLLVFLIALFARNLIRTRPGRAWMAIHSRDVAAEAMGIAIGRYKVAAFMVSGAITGLAGCVYAYYTNVASVEEYNFLLTIQYLAMIIVGGMGSVLGSIFGAFIITVLPFLLMFIFGLLEVSGTMKEFFFAVQSGFFGIVIIVFILFEPLGLQEIWRRIRDYFMLWPFKHKPLSPAKR